MCLVCKFLDLGWAVKTRFSLVDFIGIKSWTTSTMVEGYTELKTKKVEAAYVAYSLLIMDVIKETRRWN